MVYLVNRAPESLGDPEHRGSGQQSTNGCLLVLTTGRDYNSLWMIQMLHINKVIQ